MKLKQKRLRLQFQTHRRKHGEVGGGEAEAKNVVKLIKLKNKQQRQTLPPWP